MKQFFKNLGLLLLVLVLSFLIGDYVIRFYGKFFPVQYG